MQVFNDWPTTVDLMLRCFTVRGSSKTLRLSVPGKGMAEMGFLQGWPDNFVYGERCEAYSGGQLMWEERVPPLR